jgi:hypothetical protein
MRVFGVAIVALPINPVIEVMGQEHRSGPGKTALSFTELNLPVYQKPGCLGERQEFAVRAQ